MRFKRGFDERFYDSHKGQLERERARISCKGRALFFAI